MTRTGRARLAGIAVIAGAVTLSLPSPAKESTAPSAQARATLRNLTGKEVGRVSARETPTGLLLQIEITGIEPGQHAVHFHEVGKCEPPFESAGAHANPGGKAHGFLQNAGPHAGDLPNIYVEQTGNARIELIAPQLALSGSSGLLDDNGSALIVHEKPDDYRTDPAGASGGRIACGVLQRGSAR
jgi:Cu-Zn family superoxide dismutase